MARERRMAGKNGLDRAYVHGSAAPAIDIRRQLEVEEPVHRVSKTTRRNREKQRSMSPAYLTVLVLCLCIAVGVIISYLNWQSRVTSQVATINKLESRLNQLVQDNDENWNRINSNIDLEEIKRIAIGELGMTYAQEGQVVTYTGEGTDYMRKVVED